MLESRVQFFRPHELRARNADMICGGRGVAALTLQEYKRKFP